MSFTTTAGRTSAQDIANAQTIREASRLPALCDPADQKHVENTRIDATSEMGRTPKYNADGTQTKT